MAQEVQIAGATYSDVPSIEVPDSNGTYHSFVDSSDANRSVSEILRGYTRYVNGSKITGTISPSTPVSSTISSKDTVITVPRGYYTGSSTVQIANAEQSKIIANNIRSGVTILGVGGSTNVVNTGDANATRADIASGKTRYSNGVKLMGSLTPGVTYTRGTGIDITADVISVDMSDLFSFDPDTGLLIINIE